MTERNAAIREALTRLSGLINLLDDIKLEIEHSHEVLGPQRGKEFDHGITKLKEAGRYLDGARRTWIVEDMPKPNGRVDLNKTEVKTNGNG